MNTNEQRHIELSHLDTVLLHDTVPFSPPRTQEVSASSSTEKTLSLTLPSLAELSHLRKPLTSTFGLAVLLAIVAGIVENTATFGFSLDTQIATTGIASVITSGYALIVILYGIVMYHERLTRNQIVGIALFTFGLIFLAFIP
jgi:drug/metabolite transporter (DMT)-like permease